MINWQSWYIQGRWCSACCAEQGRKTRALLGINWYYWIITL